MAIISRVRDSSKHLIKNKLQTVQKLDSLLGSPSSLQPSNRLIAPQTPNIIHENSQTRITAIATQQQHLNASLPIATQLVHQNKVINPHLKPPIASQIPLQNSKPQKTQIRRECTKFPL